MRLFVTNFAALTVGGVVDAPAGTVVTGTNDNTSDNATNNEISRFFMN
jgi:hypothetical protein